MFNESFSMLCELDCKALISACTYDNRKFIWYSKACVFVSPGSLAFSGKARKWGHRVFLEGAHSQNSLDHWCLVGSYFGDTKNKCLGANLTWKEKMFQHFVKNAFLATIAKYKIAKLASYNYFTVVLFGYNNFE